MTAALKRFRANLRALGNSLWFQLVILTLYFYVLYTAIGLNDTHIGILAGILAGICTGVLLPGIADVIGEKIKKWRGQTAEPKATDAMVNAFSVAYEGRHAGEAPIRDQRIRDALAAALKARDEN